MKTNIRTFIAMAALGLFGLANINATTDNKREVNANVVAAKEESLTNELGMFGDIYKTIKSQNETMEAENELNTETTMTEERSFFNVADAVTASGVRKEIEKYSNKQVALEEIRNRK
ncbi:MAG TPA: hypothetical protein DCL77_03680 [Prolixibacteraceae bacterium]|jgi:hypothetical protein|nr:hypothetical protein [Prolixibacteraceae bacterium]